jgi:hypothetical protein
MKERTIKEPKGKGSVPKKALKAAVKKVANDKAEKKHDADESLKSKDKKPAGGKNDKDNNSVRPASGKADGKPRKK